jgi:hypothetical protein
MGGGRFSREQGTGNREQRTENREQRTGSGETELGTGHWDRLGDREWGIYIEEKIVEAVRGLLLGRVNEALGEAEFAVPPIEFGGYRGGSVVVPRISLSACERSEKDRIVRADVYSLTIAFAVPEYPAGERACYAYAAAVAAALREDPTIGGVVDRAELLGKKYTPPKCSGAGGEWEAVLALRITIEETNI